LAAVFRGPGNPLELGSFPLPDLRAGEVLVAIDCCTICGSDLHTIRGDRPVAGPMVLGHEMSGRVVELSSAGPPPADVVGDEIELGDRITWSVAAACGQCFFCSKGLPQKCEQLFKYGHETLDRSELSGGLAEYCRVVAGSAMVKLPPSLPDFIACPANCATATVAAAMRVSGECAGNCVIIHGGGMLGLTAAAMTRSQGAAAVIVTDIAEPRLARAEGFGATNAISVAEGTEHLNDVIDQLTNKRGADLVFEMSGSTTAIEESVGQLRIGGRLVLVGSVFPSRAVRLAPEQLVRKMLRIDGVHNYTPADLSTAVEFLNEMAEKFPFESLVDAYFSLQDVNAAIESASDSNVIRVAVHP